MNSGRDKRGAKRFMAVLPATMHQDGEEYRCSADNVSRSGLMLQGRLPEPDGPDLTVTVTTPAQDLSLQITGRVVHVRRADESNELRIGLHFERLSEAEADRLELLISRVIEGMAPAALADLDDKAPIEQLRAALAKVPLAHRVTLAARALPRERAILIQDTQPEVLEGLARNPHLTLPEVRTLMRRPDLLPSTLELVARNARWLRDEEVKLKVVTHPRVTFDTANRVVSQMNDRELQKVIRLPGLQQGVKQKLSARFARRHRG